MSDAYLEVISFIGRVHRQFLEAVKLEPDGVSIRDINNVQVMMLFNIGEAEMTVAELTLRGCYLGSKRWLQRQEHGRAGLSYATAFGARPPISSRPTDRNREEVAGRPDGGAWRHVNLLLDGPISADDL